MEDSRPSLRTRACVGVGVASITLYALPSVGPTSELVRIFYCKIFATIKRVILKLALII